MLFVAGNSHGNLYRSVDGLQWSMVLDSTITTGKMRVVRTGNLFFSFGTSSTARPMGRPGPSARGTTTISFGPVNATWG